MLDTILALIAPSCCQLPCPQLQLCLAPGSWPAPSSKPPCGPSQMSSTTSTSQEPLPQALPQVSHHPPGPSPTAYPGPMWPHSRTFLHWVQACTWALLTLATGCRRGRWVHWETSSCHHSWASPQSARITAACSPIREWTEAMVLAACPWALPPRCSYGPPSQVDIHRPAQDCKYLA